MLLPYFAVGLLGSWLALLLAYFAVGLLCSWLTSQLAYCAVGSLCSWLTYFAVGLLCSWLTLQLTYFALGVLCSWLTLLLTYFALGLFCCWLTLLLEEGGGRTGRRRRRTRRTRRTECTLKVRTPSNQHGEQPTALHVLQKHFPWQASPDPTSYADSRTHHWKRHRGRACPMNLTTLHDFNVRVAKIAKKLHAKTRF